MAEADASMLAAGMMPLDDLMPPRFILQEQSTIRDSGHETRSADQRKL